MKYLKFVFSLFLFLSLFSCSPSYQTHLKGERFPTLHQDAAFYFLEANELPKGYVTAIGSIEVSKAMANNRCSYAAILEETKKKALKEGANIVVITKVSKPGALGACYGLQGQMFKADDTAVISDLEKLKEQKNQSRIATTEGVAKVHFYRPKHFVGSGFAYRIRTDEGSLGKLKNGKVITYETSEYGKQRFWAKTERTHEIEIDIQPGQEYFVSCSLKAGFWIGRPEMYLVENHMGIADIAKIEE